MSVDPSSPIESFRAHADFRGRMTASGIGAAVTRSTLADGHRIWDCIVSDGREWHFVRVVGEGLGPFENFSAEDIEEAIERFAATLPGDDRIRHLLNANPLHLDRAGEVHD